MLHNGINAKGFHGLVQMDKLCVWNLRKSTWTVPQKNENLKGMITKHVEISSALSLMLTVCMHNKIITNGKY